MLVMGRAEVKGRSTDRTLIVSLTHAAIIGELTDERSAWCYIVASHKKCYQGGSIVGCQTERTRGALERLSTKVFIQKLIFHK